MGSEPCSDRTPTELEYIKLCYNDVIARISEQKALQWQIVRWVAALDIAVVGFSYSTITINVPELFAFIPIVIGIIGLLNYVTVQRDLNHHRRTLLSLYEFMGGFVDKLHAVAKVPYSKGSWLSGIRNSQVAIIVLVSLLSSAVLVCFGPEGAHKRGTLDGTKANVSQKLIGFFDCEIVQTFKSERCLFDHASPRDQEAL